MAVPKADFENPTGLVNAKQLKRSLISSCRFKRHYSGDHRGREPSRMSGLPCD